jgi:hypothetical protein
VKNPHKPNPQRATNRPRRPLQKKEGGGRKTIGNEKKKKKKKQKQKQNKQTNKQKTKKGRSGREGEERRHQD